MRKYSSSHVHTQASIHTWTYTTHTHNPHIKKKKLGSSGMCLNPALSQEKERKIEERKNSFWIKWLFSLKLLVYRISDWFSDVKLIFLHWTPCTHRLHPGRQMLGEWKINNPREAEATRTAHMGLSKYKIEGRAREWNINLKSLCSRYPHSHNHGQEIKQGIERSPGGGKHQLLFQDSGWAHLHVSTQPSVVPFWRDSAHSSDIHDHHTAHAAQTHVQAKHSSTWRDKI